VIKRRAKSAVLCSALLVIVAFGARARAQEQPPNQADGVPTSGREATTDHGPNGPASRVMVFTATAYALDGKTALGTIARKGIVAADPKVLPLGSRIRISGAGKHSGEYVVEDTGPKVNGRKIDIKMDSAVEAKEFGQRKVRVEVLSYGPRRP